MTARLRERYPQIRFPPKEDICYATTNRQEAVSTLATQAEVVIVLGSQNSSNSRRLMEIGATCDARAFLIDSVSELPLDSFRGDETVLITAGASAPDVVVQECVNRLVEQFNAEVESVVVQEEHVSFPLPKELRELTVVN